MAVTRMLLSVKQCMDGTRVGPTLMRTSAGVGDGFERLAEVARDTATWAGDTSKMQRHHQSHHRPSRHRIATAIVVWVILTVAGLATPAMRWYHGRYPV
jgi:hypothetical protein